MSMMIPLVVIARLRQAGWPDERIQAEGKRLLQMFQGVEPDVRAAKKAKKAPRPPVADEEELDRLDSEDLEDEEESRHVDDGGDDDDPDVDDDPGVRDDDEEDEEEDDEEAAERKKMRAAARTGMSAEEIVIFNSLMRGAPSKTKNRKARGRRGRVDAGTKADILRAATAGMSEDERKAFRRRMGR